MAVLSLLFLLLSVLTAAQHHHHSDPFAGSGCDCDRFCRYECAINATAAPIKMRVYRMTMRDVYDLRDKDSGDPAGDTSFVLSKKNNAFMCRQNPNDFMCKDLAQFSGDDANSTDVILEILIEADGQWGPYLECNPINASVPTGKWSCETGLHSPSLPDYPKQCKSIQYRGDHGYCLSSKPDKSLTGVTQAECCGYVAKQPTGAYQAYNYYPSNQSCSLFSDYSYGDFVPCDKNITLGMYSPPDPNLCQCERVYKTVGRQNQTSHGSSSYNIAGGMWYSHPAGGQCTGDQQPGDSSGCTYRVVSVQRAIKATCMYSALDRHVEGLNQSCFGACPQPHNVTSDCYLGCYSYTTHAADKTELSKPWGQAFADDGCPQVPIDQQRLAALF